MTLVVGPEPDGLPACIHHVLLMHSTGRQHTSAARRKLCRVDTCRLLANTPKSLARGDTRSFSQPSLGDQMGRCVLDMASSAWMSCRFANLQIGLSHNPDNEISSTRGQLLMKCPKTYGSMLGTKLGPNVAAIYSILSSGLLLNFSAAVSKRFQTSTNLCWPSSLVPIPFMAAFMTSQFRSLR